MKKILLVFGTRPEAIKMAPLVKAFQHQPEAFQTMVCVTGQHREMLDQVLRIFDITPDYDLAIMKHGQDLYDITARVLIGMRDVLMEVNPDMVFVHGDTTTSTATALAAFYQQIPVAHIEAGLRTHKIYSPWPEEINRQITSRIASLHFAPTLLSRQNLVTEGINENTIKVTGNTVIDALYWVIGKMKNEISLHETIMHELIEFGLQKDKLEAWNNSCQFWENSCDTINEKSTEILPITEPRKLILITGHRRENFGDGFLNICHAIKELAIKYPDVDFVYPVHLNPNVLQPVNEILGNDDNKTTTNVHLIAPLDYLPFVYLMSKSYLVLTDSGGIQEEAPGLGKPVVVMRDTTERPEAVDAGTVVLVGTDKDRIVSEVTHLLDDQAHYSAMSQASNPYGDGNACERIIEVLKNSL